MSAGAVTPTAAELFAQLTESTGLTSDQWRDLLTLSPEDQVEAVTDWKALGHMSWCKSQSTFDTVLEVLGVVGTIAGVVGGVAGAASAVAALRSL